MYFRHLIASILRDIVGENTYYGTQVCDVRVPICDFSVAESGVEGFRTGTQDYEASMSIRETEVPIKAYMRVHLEPGERVEYEITVQSTKFGVTVYDWCRIGKTLGNRLPTVMYCAGAVLKQLYQSRTVPNGLTVARVTSKCGPIEARKDYEVAWKLETGNPVESTGKIKISSESLRVAIGRGTLAWSTRA